MARIAFDARKIRDFGIGTYIVTLLRGFARPDVEDEFVVFLPRDEELPIASPRILAVATAAASYGVREHLELPWLARRHRADLYHAPHYVLPWLAPTPSVVTVHDLIHLRFPEYLPNAAAPHYARQIMARAFRRAARVLTVSEASKADLLERFGGPADRITVIPNRLPDVFHAEISPEELERVRGRWGLTYPFILYTGNIKPHKNVPRLIEAFAELARANLAPDFRLVLVGNPSGRYQDIRRRAGELSILDRVRFLGWLPQRELAVIYRLARVFVYPSLYEGFGLPPLEAMASGTPVVTSNVSSMPEVCGDAALLVDPTNPAAIAGAVSRILEDEVLSRDLVLRGRARAEHFREIDHSGRTLAVYREVLADRT